ncbi:MAG: hypothetical protein R2771_10780 [Saprospiraceae bacterium]
MRIGIVIMVINLMFLQNFQAQNDDYRNYYKLINRAEYYYFIEHNIDSCFHNYDKAFHNYDFVFVRDLVIASEIAYFEGKEYKKYIIQAFKYGLKLDYLKEIKLFNPIIDSLLNDEELKNEFLSYRKEYLSKINFSYLLFIYDLYLDDQKYKTITDYETYHLHKLGILKQEIFKYGFPGDKTIGIDCEDIFAEIGKPELDLNFKKKLNNEYEHVVKFNRDKIFQTNINPFLYHNPNSFCELEDIFLESLKKGEIHPRLIGVFYDNMFCSRKKTFIEYKNYNINEGLFMLNPYCRYDLIYFDRKRINKIREKWFVPPIEVDESMKEYEKKYGFVCFLNLF